MFGLDGGTIYVSYNGSTDCAVLMKSAYVGTATNTWVSIEHANGAGGGTVVGNDADWPSVMCG